MPRTTGGDHAPDYRLRVLGGWALSRAGLPCPVPLRSQRLIALLAVAGPMPRAVICGRLWPESSEPHALDSLRVTIHHVGRDLPGLLATRASTVALGTGVLVDLDQERAGLVERGSAPGPDGGPVTDAELLPGWYEEWVLAEQDRLRVQRIRSHDRVAQRLFDAGDLRAAIDSAARSQALDPLDEWSLEILVRAHMELGSACAARRALLSFRRSLQHEFGQFSSPMLEELETMVAGPPRNLPLRPPVLLLDPRAGMRPLASG